MNFIPTKRHKVFQTFNFGRQVCLMSNIVIGVMKYSSMHPSDGLQDKI